jgi:hypothetical protein
MKAPWTVLLLAGVLAQAGASALPAGLEAQEFRQAHPAAAVGVNFLVGDPLGEFSRHVDVGVGAEFFGRIPLEPQGLVSLRADLGFMIYGYESTRVCFEGVGCRLQTTNNIFYGGIGPELALPLDGFRPYVNASLGFGYFNTTSSLESLWGEEDSFSTENLGDGAFSLGIGWGAEIALHRGRVPVFLNLGGRYHKNGVMRYLTEGDIQDNPDGSITLFPVVSEANLVSYRLGVTIGIPRGG